MAALMAGAIIYKVASNGTALINLSKNSLCLLSSNNIKYKILKFLSKFKTEKSGLQATEYGFFSSSINRSCRPYNSAHVNHIPT